MRLLLSDAGRENDPHAVQWKPSVAEQQRVGVAWKKKDRKTPMIREQTSYIQMSDPTNEESSLRFYELNERRGAPKKLKREISRNTIDRISCP